MSRKLTWLLVCMMLVSLLVLPASGAMIAYVSDDAGLLESEEHAALEEKAAHLASTYEIALVILTVESLGGVSAQEYADDYYDHSGYPEDGVLFLLAMAEREWYISTSGSLIYVLTDYGIQQLGESVVPYLGEGYWYAGFDYFLDLLPEYLDSYINGDPVDGFADYSGDYYQGQQDEVLYYEAESSPNFFYSLFAGLAVAAISLLIMRSGMNTKRSQRSAGDYMEAGSWNLYQHRDLFLYSNVTKTRRQEDNSGGGHSGGGSSVHRASSGRRHGGGGGKF